jgi:hypothetical protein
MSGGLCLPTALDEYSSALATNFGLIQPGGLPLHVTPNQPGIDLTGQMNMLQRAANPAAYVNMTCIGQNSLPAPGLECGYGWYPGKLQSHAENAITQFGGGRRPFCPWTYAFTQLPEWLRVDTRDSAIRLSPCTASEANKGNLEVMDYSCRFRPFAG